ncbi:MAG TPA: hypothetical protein VIH57_26170 [Bacteroidales bacterium]
MRYKLSTVNYGLWPAGYGLWSIDYRQFSVDSLECWHIDPLVFYFISLPTISEKIE